MAKGRIVQVRKIDLDTCGAAFFLGVSREDKVEVLRGEASLQDLADPDVICIEVGGSGQPQLNDWDHHGVDSKKLSSATYQVWRYKFFREGFVGLLYQLVGYIDKLDTRGPQALGRRQKGKFPNLSDVFAGMLLVTREPVEQLHAGIEILREVVHRGINPYGRMPIKKILAWTAFAEAKAENNRQVAKAVKGAQWTATALGFKLAWLETDFFGAPGALYGVGAQVVVVFSPHFGPAGVPKFTIAGNGIKVDAALSELNAREPGWGGPPTGTILGSPREGSCMTLDEVVKIVRRKL